MQVQQFFLILGVTIIFVRMLTTFLHELGHAIPGLLFTDGEVTMYVGTYGDPAKNHQIKLGRLTVFLRYNPFQWSAGLVKVASDQINVAKRVSIAAGGPLFSLVTACLMMSLVFWGGFQGIYNMMFIFLGVSCLYDFIVNIVPNKRPIKLFDGTEAKNDGATIKEILKFRNYPKEYFESETLFFKKEYEKANEILAELIEQKKEYEQVLRLYSFSLMSTKKLDEALKILNRMEELFGLSALDYVNRGYIYSERKDFERGLLDYNLSLEKDPEQIYALNNRGYEYIRTGQLDKALLDFNQVLYRHPNFAHALANRGWVHLLNRDYEKAKNNLDRALASDPNHAYAHRNYGIYYFDQADYPRALEYFEKAKALDATTDMIDEWLEKTKAKEGNNKN